MHDARIYSTLKMLARPLPDDTAYRYGHDFARASYLRYLRSRLGPYVREVDPVLYRLTTSSSRPAPWTRVSSANTGRPTSTSPVPTRRSTGWLQLLEPHGFNLRTCGSVFEIGTGSARLLRMLRPIEGIRLVGCDVVADDIAWCRKNIPGADFYQTISSRPWSSPATPSSTWSWPPRCSRTSRSERQQDWLREIYRVLRPGGFFLCTVTGWYDAHRQLTDHDREELRSVGSVTLTAGRDNGSLSTKVLDSWDIHQARWVVLREFRRVFDVLDFMPDKQDLLVLGRPVEIAAPAASPTPPSPRMGQAGL